MRTFIVVVLVVLIVALLVVLDGPAVIWLHQLSNVVAGIL